jgi:hypothetical protein
MRLMILTLVILLMAGGVAQAQPAEPLCPGLDELSPGTIQSGTITNQNSLIGYCYLGTVGETITVQATATSGDLDTYLGIIDPSSNEVFAENDDIVQGNTDSEVTFEIPADGYYLVIVTRFNFEEGVSTGDFDVVLTRDGASAPGGDDRDDNLPLLGDGSTLDADAAIFVECDTGERISGGVQFSYINVDPGFPYTVTVIGLDGFDPVLAVETRPGIGTCNDDNRDGAGSVVLVPEEGEVVGDSRTSQITFTTPQRGFPTNLLVGSFNDEPGRFVMVIEGFRIAPEDDLDGFSVRVPARSAEEPLSVYIISETAELDPTVGIGTGPGLTNAYSDGDFDPDAVDFDRINFPVLECNDMGRGTCDFTPELPGGVLSISGGGEYIVGPFDAGLSLIPNTTDPILYAFGSAGSASSGTYAIAIFGYVPGSGDAEDNSSVAQSN